MAKKILHKNPLTGRWSGIVKVKEGFKAYTIKNGYITHGTFKKRIDALKQFKKFKTYN